VNHIVEDLIRNGYSQNTDTKVFQSLDYKDIAYNDGDESENRVLSAIKNAIELDSLSDELEAHCTDWPSTYHLSKRRGNLLRPFVDHFNNKTILEIGSGMGPITRLLGESNANVLALEGTSRRAQATRLRTRDLENVTVLAEKFDELQTDLKFDFITLIGVLEYSNLYTNAENPHLHVIRRCFDLLTPEGHLIIAIENKLGLKYFAGANEDHVGIPMFGLENRYSPKSVRTFGRVELEQLLSASGFKNSTFNSPLPDYKLTTSVISENGFKEKKFNSTDLTRDAFGADPQLPASLAFTPELVLTSLSQNDLELDLANSFLVVANKGAVRLVKKTDLAWHFSTNRRKAFCVQTVFNKGASGTIHVIKKKMSTVTIDGPLLQKIVRKTNYLEGSLLRDHLEMVLSTPSWRHLDLLNILNEYKKFLLGYQSGHQEMGKFLLVEGAVDLIPRNIVVGTDEDWRAFDAEWETTTPVDLRYLLFRAVLSLHTISHFAVDEFEEAHTPKSLFTLICQLLDLEMDEILIAEFLKLEVLYQNSVNSTLGNVEALSLHFLNPLGRNKFQPHTVTISARERDSAIAERDSAIAERDSAIAGRDSAIAGRDSAIAERDSAIAERDSAIAERDSAIAERDSAIAERDLILNSTIWRLFSPYRKLKNLFPGN
jgi:2-polyprenyl-3-methyl-5-hydroxy-6-metoxy-1,4-benzoquinol methylase